MSSRLRRVLDIVRRIRDLDSIDVSRAQRDSIVPSSCRCVNGRLKDTRDPSNYSPHRTSQGIPTQGSGYRSSSVLGNKKLIMNSSGLVTSFRGAIRRLAFSGSISSHKLCGTCKSTCRFRRPCIDAKLRQTIRHLILHAWSSCSQSPHGRDGRLSRNSGGSCIRGTGPTPFQMRRSERMAFRRCGSSRYGSHCLNLGSIETKTFDE